MKGVFEDKQTLSTAVSDWVANEATTEETHGAISGWDTSRVDDMSELFKDKTGFNAQLNWDTSQQVGNISITRRTRLRSRGMRTAAVLAVVMIAPSSDDDVTVAADGQHRQHPAPHQLAARRASSAPPAVWRGTKNGSSHVVGRVAL